MRRLLEMHTWMSLYLTEDWLLTPNTFTLGTSPDVKCSCCGDGLKFPAAIILSWRLQVILPFAWNVRTTDTSFNMHIIIKYSYRWNYVLLTSVILWCGEKRSWWLTDLLAIEKAMTFYKYMYGVIPELIGKWYTKQPSLTAATNAGTNQSTENTPVSSAKSGATVVEMNLEKWLPVIMTTAQFSGFIQNVWKFVAFLRENGIVLTVKRTKRL